MKTIKLLSWVLRKSTTKHIPEAVITTAENGLQAIELLSKIESPENLPCFIILDINMPILNGIEFLELIRKDDALKQIPVVVHTTSSNVEDYKTCKKHRDKRLLCKTR